MPNRDFMMAEVAGFPFIEVGGPPRERGRQYGEQAAARIKRGIEHYSAQLELAKLHWKHVAAIGTQFGPSIASFDSSYPEEMQGIAEGAGVEYAAVVMLNARTEVLKIAQRRQHGEGGVFLESDECTGVVVLPAATKSG